MKRHTILKRNTLPLLAAALLSACSGSDDSSGATRYTEGAAVSFSTQMQTRSAVNSLDDLKNLSEGFGVLAYLTDGTTWASATGGATPATFPPPDFMYNQPVRWGGLYTMRDASGNIVYDEDSNPVVVNDWIYSPLKYWPNYSDNDALTPRRISFFAYAPFTEIANSATGSTGLASGITTLTNDADRRPYLVYQMDESAGSVQHDLLWSEPAIDCTRNGNGLIEVATVADVKTNTYQKVPLSFHHATAGVEIYVQRVYDEPTYSGKAPDKEQHTKLFVSQLTLSATNAAGTVGLFSSGRLDLTDGHWTNTDGSTWPAGTTTLTYSEDQFNDIVRGTASAELANLRDYELNKWGMGYDSATDTWTDDYGVDEEERLLLRQGLATLLPSGGDIVITPHVQYSMVTRDDDLALSTLSDKEGHLYSRLVNSVDGNPLRLNLEAGKKYKLIVRLGVEHVSFEVVSVVDWDFPLRFNPTAGNGFEEETVEHTVSEE